MAECRDPTAGENEEPTEALSANTAELEWRCCLWTASSCGGVHTGQPDDPWHMPMLLSSPYHRSACVYAQ